MGNIKRRDFLKLTSLSTGAILTSSLLNIPFLKAANTKHLPTGKGEKILILGAGLAGLCSAYELKKLGYDVTLLEAQLRSGGRVITFREPFSDGLWADAGAARIPDNHDWTMKYVNEFNLDLVPFYPDEYKDLRYIDYLNNQKVLRQAGQTLRFGDYPLDFTQEEADLTVDEATMKFFGEVFNEMGSPLGDNFPEASLKKYDDVTLKGFIEQKGHSAGIEKILNLGWNDGPDWSLLDLAAEVYFFSKEKMRYKVAGGNDLIPAGFATKLKDEIIYGAEAFKLKQDGNSSRVFFKRAGKVESLTADKIICTIPFPVLRSFEFEPSLTPLKQKAVNELYYGDLSRVFLQVNKRYWLDNNLNGFALTDYPTEIWHPTFEQPGPRGLIEVYVKFTDKTGFDNWNIEKQLNVTLDHVENVFPGIRKYYEGGTVKSWRKDKYAGSATAVYLVGQMMKFKKAIPLPEGNVHFAGEHTSVYHGWMQGALESAHRVIKEING